MPGIAERINAQIKYRERWRPFCPSMLDRAAADILGTEHPAPYMTFTFDVAEKWKTKIPEVVHLDGTARPPAEPTIACHEPEEGVRVEQGPTVVFKTLQAGKYPPAAPHIVRKLTKGRGKRLGTYGDPMAVPAWVWEDLVYDYLYVVMPMRLA